MKNYVNADSEMFVGTYDEVGNDYKVAPMFFDSWDFTVDNKTESQALRKAIKIEIFTEIKVAEIQERIKKRTIFEWRLLRLRRAVLFLINASFVALCCYAIVVANVNKEEIIAWSKAEIDKRKWIPNKVADFT